VRNKLSTLKYSDLWLKFGFLTEESLDDQIKNFEKGEDKNTEHYRYSSFRKYLSLGKVLTDDEIAKYLHLAEIDEDKWMAQSAIRDLVGHRNLTDSQFEKVCSILSQYGEGTKKFISREILYRKLRKSVNEEVSLTENVFLEFFNQNNGNIHWYLISYADKNQLELIAEKGATKAVRHIARQELRKKFR
jgi:hypothetical protein